VSRPNPNDPQYQGYGSEDFTPDLKKWRDLEQPPRDDSKICWKCSEYYTYYYSEGKPRCPYCGVS